MRLLNLVKEEDGEGLASNRLGERAALAETDVPWGCAHELGHAVPLHVLGHVQSHHVVLAAKVLLRQTPRELSLAHAGRTREEHGRDRAVRILESASRAPEGPGHRADRLLLANHGALEILVHVGEDGLLVERHALHRDAAPHRRDRLDLVDRHLGATVRAVAGELVHLHAELGEVGLHLALPVAQESSLLEEQTPHGRLLRLAHLLERAPHLHSLHGRGLIHLASALLLSHVLLDTSRGARLVDEVDGLVGEESIGDVSAGYLNRRDQGVVGDLAHVMSLVALAEAEEDLDGVLLARLLDHHGLETALERGILLDVLAVLVHRGGADELELATRQGGLEHVADVHAAAAALTHGAGADERVNLVDHEHDVLLVLNLLDEAGDPRLELAALLRARHEQADVQGQHALLAEELRDVTGDDSQREALRDGRLSDAGFAEEDRVVLGAPGENLNHALNLLVPADDRVDLLVPRALREVEAEVVQRGLLVLLLSLLLALTRREGSVGSRRRPRLLLLLRLQPALSLVLDEGAAGGEHLEVLHQGLVVELGDGERDVLGGYVVHAHVGRVVQSRLEDSLGAAAEGNLGGGRAPRGAVRVERDDLLSLLARRVDGDAGAEPAALLGLLGDEAHHDVLDANLGSTKRLGLLLREHDSLDGALGELLEDGGHHEFAASLRVWECVGGKGGVSRGRWGAGRVVWQFWVFFFGSSPLPFEIWIRRGKSRGSRGVP